jgi:hypothetical protein
MWRANDITKNRLMGDLPEAAGKYQEETQQRRAVVLDIVNTLLTEHLKDTGRTGFPSRKFGRKYVAAGFYSGTEARHRCRYRTFGRTASSPGNSDSRQRVTRYEL